MSRPGQLVRARLPLAAAARDRCRAIGCAAGYFIDGHLSLVAVGQADDQHAEMHQVGNDREEGGLVAAVLSRTGGEGGTDLADELAAGPVTSSLLPEIRHLRGDPAKAGRRAHDEGIVIGQISNSGHRCTLFELEVKCLGCLLRYSLRHALDVHLRAAFPYTFSHRIRHGLEMTIAR